MQQPTIGSIVIFTNGRGEVWPALITQVNPDETLSLTVFHLSGFTFASSVPFSENPKKLDPQKPPMTLDKGTWNWPQRAP